MNLRNLFSGLGDPPNAFANAVGWKGNTRGNTVVHVWSYLLSIKPSSSFPNSQSQEMSVPSEDVPFALFGISRRLLLSVTLSWGACLALTCHIAQMFSYFKLQAVLLELLLQSFLPKSLHAIICLRLGLMKLNWLRLVPGARPLGRRACLLRDRVPEASVLGFVVDIAGS